MTRGTLVAALLTCVLAAGCGGDEGGGGGEGTAEPPAEGITVQLDGIEYTVPIARPLNPNIPPDRAFFDRPPPRGRATLFGVFMKACNVGDDPQRTTGKIALVDPYGHRIEPIDLEEENPFAYEPRRLAPDFCIPRRGAVARDSAAGALLAFEVPRDVYANRQLSLAIEAGGERKLIKLDV